MITDTTLQSALMQMLDSFQLVAPTPPEPGQLVDFKIRPEIAAPLSIGDPGERLLELAVGLNSEAHAVTGDITGKIPVALPTGVITPTALDNVKADLEAAAHEIVGTVKGLLPLSLVTTLLPRLEITWHVTDANGQELEMVKPSNQNMDLSDGPRFLAPGGVNGASLPIAFIPRFVPLETINPQRPPVDMVSVSVEIQLTLTFPRAIPGHPAGAFVRPPTAGQRRSRRFSLRNDIQAKVTLGSIQVPVPVIPIPTVAALTVDSQFQGAVLLVVPSNSPLQSLEDVLNALRPVHRVLGYLHSVAQLANFFLGIGLLIDVLELQPRIAFCVTPNNKINNLNNITLVQNSWYENDIEAENELSALLLLGAKGRRFSCSCRRNNEKGKDGNTQRQGPAGQFEITLGNTLWAGIRTLHSRQPKAEPADSRVTITDEPGYRNAANGVGPLTFTKGTFGDNLSSLKFL